MMQERIVRTTTSRILITLVVALYAVASAQELTLPLKPDSVRFLVIGDTGTGESAEFEVAAQTARYRAKFPFTFALLLGDNLYGSERPQDYARKFELPFKALLDQKVEFHAALGNHDDPNQKFYKPFNLGGERYRTFKKGNVRFFVLDSNYMDPEQLQWLEKELKASGSDWKIPYFHHPIYTSATRGPVIELRAAVEPLFLKYGVDVVFAGHEHIYERLKPQKGLEYLVVGGAAKLRRGDIRKTGLTAAGFDQDQSFLLAEVAGDELHFQAISRKGDTVDRGVITRRQNNEGKALTPEAPSTPKMSAPPKAPPAKEGSAPVTPKAPQSPAPAGRP
jgi:predicted phosphodiesterase